MACLRAAATDWRSDTVSRAWAERYKSESDGKGAQDANG